MGRCVLWITPGILVWCQLGPMHTPCQSGDLPGRADEGCASGRQQGGAAGFLAHMFGYEQELGSCLDWV